MTDRQFLTVAGIAALIALVALLAGLAVVQRVW